MLDSYKVKELLSTEDIIKLCCELQESDIYLLDTQGNPIFSTYLDHSDGGSMKMYYYPATKLFYCYTTGTTKDIFDVVQQVKQFPEFIQAFDYVVKYFNIKDDTPRSTVKELTSDWDIFQQIIDYSDTKDKTQEIPIIQENMLEYFYPLAAPQEWLDDRIGAEVMYHFGIRIDSALQKIVIPQRDIDGNLIGIRGRSFNPIEIADGKKYMPVFIEGQIFNTPNGQTLFGLYENKETIQRLKRVLIVEGEKSVMQLATYYGTDSCWAVATYGSNISATQVQLLLNLGVEEIIIGFDRDFDGGRGDEDTVSYEQKILKTIEPLQPYVNISIILDYDHLLPEKKMSPTDAGREIFEKLFHQRIPLKSDIKTKK